MNKKQIKKPVRLSVSIDPDLNDMIMELCALTGASKASIISDTLSLGIPEFLDGVKGLKEASDEGKKNPQATAAFSMFRKLMGQIEEVVTGDNPKTK